MGVISHFQALGCGQWRELVHLGPEDWRLALQVQHQRRYRDFSQTHTLPTHYLRKLTIHQFRVLIHVIIYVTAGTAIISMCYSPNGVHLAVGLVSGEIQVFDIESNVCLFELCHADKVN